MPRIHVHIDDIEDLDAQDDLEQQLSAHTHDEPRHDVRSGMSGRFERRMGGAEARDRRNSERRKHVQRGKQQQ